MNSDSLKEIVEREIKILGVKDIVYYWYLKFKLILLYNLNELTKNIKYS